MEGEDRSGMRKCPAQVLPKCLQPDSKECKTQGIEQGRSSKAKGYCHDIPSPIR